MSRRVVITGIGVVAPGGVGTKEFWSLLTSGTTATRGISLFDASQFRSRIAAEADFDPLDHGFSPEEAERLDRAAQFALVSSEEALRDSGLAVAELDPTRTGVTLGSAVGCTMGLEPSTTPSADGGQQLGGRPHPRGAAPLRLLRAQLDGCRGRLAHRCPGPGRHGLHRLHLRSGLRRARRRADPRGQRRRDDRRRHRGARSPRSRWPVSTPSRPPRPATTSPAPRRVPSTALAQRLRPRRGRGRPGPGGARAARRRGAHVYAEIAGFASRCNAYHMTGLRPDGREMAEAITVALDEARLDADRRRLRQRPRLGDQAERPPRDRGLQAEPRAARATRSPSAPSSPWSATPSGRSAPWRWPPARWPSSTTRCRRPPTCTTPTRPATWTTCRSIAREQRTDTVLSVGSGFGGFQSAMVLTRPRPGDTA